MSLSACVHSRRLPVVVVFLAIMVDAIVLSFLLPVLPRFLQQYYCHPNNSSSSVPSRTVNVSRLTIPQHNSTKTCDDVTISRHVGFIVGVGPLIELLVSPFVGYFVSLVGEGAAFKFGSVMELLGVSMLITIGEE